MANKWLRHYYTKYKEVRNKHSLQEANKRALIVLSLVIRRIITKVSVNISKILEKQDINNKRVLVIEATNRWNWWWLWDWIFRTAAITDMYNSWLEVDVVTHVSRRDIFLHNPHINNTYYLDWTILNFLRLSNQLRWNSYGWIMSFYRETYRPLLATLIWIRIKKYIEPQDIWSLMNRNPIETYRQIVQWYFPDIIRWDWKTSIKLIGKEIAETKMIITKQPGKIYVWINIWWASALRNFKKWKRVLSEIHGQYWDKIIFVLYWRENILWIDKELEQNFSNIINLVWKISTLRIVYWVINAMDLNIGMDWWNINASIALWRPTIPIYNIVKWINRVPVWFDISMIVQWWCENWHCWEKTNYDDFCLKNNQAISDHNITPPCLEDTRLVDEIISKTSKQISILLLATNN